MTLARDVRLRLAVECPEHLRAQASADMEAAMAEALKALAGAQRALDAKYPREAPAPKAGCCGE